MMKHRIRKRTNEAAAHGINPHVWYRFDLAQMNMIAAMCSRRRNRRRRISKWSKAMAKWLPVLLPELDDDTLVMALDPK